MNFREKHKKWEKSNGSHRIERLFPSDAVRPDQIASSDAFKNAWVASAFVPIFSLSFRTWHRGPICNLHLPLLLWRQFFPLCEASGSSSVMWFMFVRRDTFTLPARTKLSAPAPALLHIFLLDTSIRFPGEHWEVALMRSCRRIFLMRLNIRLHCRSWWYKPSLRCWMHWICC